LGQGALPLEPRKENFLEEVFLDLSRTLKGRKLRFRQKQIRRTLKNFSPPKSKISADKGF
jgi:hypothetical protein